MAKSSPTKFRARPVDISGEDGYTDNNGSEFAVSPVANNNNNNTNSTHPLSPTWVTKNNHTSIPPAEFRTPPRGTDVQQQQQRRKNYSKSPSKRNGSSKSPSKRNGSSPYRSGADGSTPTTTASEPAPFLFQKSPSHGSNSTAMHQDNADLLRETVEDIKDVAAAAGRMFETHLHKFTSPRYDSKGGGSETTSSSLKNTTTDGKKSTSGQQQQQQQSSGGEYENNTDANNSAVFDSPTRQAQQEFKEKGAAAFASAARMVEHTASNFPFTSSQTTTERRGETSYDSFVISPRRQQRNRNQQQNNNTKEGFAIQDILLSPFTACNAVTRVVNNSTNEAASLAAELASCRMGSPGRGGIFNRERSYENSEYLQSFDNQTFQSMNSEEQEELLQMQRLGSWDTIGTHGTTHSINSTTTGTTDGSYVTHGSFQDDDGNKINPILLEKVERRREQRRSLQANQKFENTTPTNGMKKSSSTKGSKPRQKVVKFDYPPVSSLRACPRHEQEDLPNLFFTEEELEQIEEDRYNTQIADDVEIIAVASPLSNDDDFDAGNNDEIDGSQHPPENQAGDGSVSSMKGMFPRSKGSYSKSFPASKIRRSRLSPPPSPVQTDSESSGERQQQQIGNDSENADKYRVSSGSERSSRIKARNATPRKDRRLVKGVQIYLRERSHG